MAISFQCPKCQRSYKVKDALAGKKAPCLGCQAVMTVPRLALDPAHSHALEELASDVLGDEPGQQSAAADDVSHECPFCFEPVTFPVEKAGKQAPCPSCRKIIRVPVPQTGKPKSDWRAIEHNLTMARRDDQPAPEGAWGYAQNQSIVSRDALLEARVVRDRKELAARNWTPWLVTAAVVVVLGGASGGWWAWNRSVESRRAGLVADAVKSLDPKAASPGLAAAVFTAAGEFWLREPEPNLAAAVGYFNQARAAALAAESPTDRAGLLLEIAVAQSQLVGDDVASEAKQVLSWEESQRELRQTLQSFKDLGREHGWLVIEELTRRLSSVGPKRPVMVALAPYAMPTDADRAGAIACVGLVLNCQNDAKAGEVADEAAASHAAVPGAEPSPRLIALMLARGQAAAAKQLLPESSSAEPRLLGHAEGFARAGDAEKARRVAMEAGTEEQQVAALALAAEADPANLLEGAVQFAAEKGRKFTLPAWALDRLGRTCRRAQRPDLARHLADNVAQKDVKPWLELSALRAELDGSSSPAEAALAERVGDKSAAQGLAWVAIARHNARLGKGDPRVAVSAWVAEAARPPGLSGSALGLQDRRR